MLFNSVCTYQKADSNISKLPMMRLARYLVLADTLLESQLYPKTPPDFSLNFFSSMTFLTQVASNRDLEGMSYGI